MWVCFDRPVTQLPADALILSFALPGTEAVMEACFAARLVSGREVIQEIRPQARAKYVELIARIGSTPIVGGRTLRQALLGTEGHSHWWFLGPTEKDCVWDEDTTYTTLLRLLAVETVRQRYRVERVRVFGAPRAMTIALGHSRDGLGGVMDLAAAVVLGLASRLALILEYLSFVRALRPLKRPVERRDVLLQAYWDWSVTPASDGRLRDRYFTDLPGILASRGLSVGWLASCEPHSAPWQRRRRSSDVVASSRPYRDLVLLERYLTPADIVRVAANLRDALRVTHFVRNPRFRALCKAEDLDLYPLVRKLLLRAAWGGTVCRLQLLATATARACRELRPRMVLTSMELFLRSRAIYAGLSACAHRVRVWAAQHAGYSSDKTLGVYDPEIEIRGTPDGCAVPAPDGIFVMGDLSRRIWEANGLGRERVIPTGGLRYQSVQVQSRTERVHGAGTTLLLVGGMNEAAELDMCDAAVEAASGLPSVRIVWRDHPSYRFSLRRAFRRFRGTIAVTSGNVDEDLEAADLVIFTHTGLAEEALLRGIPTWQWLWPGFNTSPFLDVPVIPSFTSVSALRRGLQAFLRDPGPYRPTIEAQRRVLHECFGADPADAAVRMADAIDRMLGSQLGGHP